MGRVCSIHEEWCPDGNCRWCETPAVQEEGLAAGDGFKGTIWYTSPFVAMDYRFKTATNRLLAPRKGYSAVMTGVTMDLACVHEWWRRASTDARECSKCGSLRAESEFH